MKGIAHVELSVSDLDASASWYTALLGATETFRAANDGYDIVSCALRALRSRQRSRSFRSSQRRHSPL
jgi:catechol 2,3-dioxygenase-like lactoylglutathione lyase family enzyme